MKLELPDPSTGELVIEPSQTRIVPRMREDAFLRTAEGSTSAVFTSNPPHVSYRLSDLYNLDGLQVGVTARFASGTLVTMSVFIATGAQTWGEWSEKEELENRDKLEGLLTVKYGGTRTFSWGSIGAAYDPRGGSATLAIRYP